MYLPGDKVAVTRGAEVFIDVISQVVLHDNNINEYYFLEHDDGADLEQCKLLESGGYDLNMPLPKYARGDYIKYNCDMDGTEYVRKIKEVQISLFLKEPPAIRYYVDCEWLDWACEEKVLGKMVMV